MNLIIKIKKISYHFFSIIALIKGLFAFHSYKALDDKKVIYITPFAIKYDGRVRKSVDSLIAKGFFVQLIKPVDAWNDEVVSWHPNLTVIPLGLSGSYVYFPYVLDWNVFKYLKRSTASSIYCRDFFTGVMAILATRKSNKKVIVDFYEWYSETKSCVGFLSLKKKLYQFYERFVCRYADRLITNNVSFAQGISQGVVSVDQFTIIRNIPDHAVIDSQLNLRHHLPLEMCDKKILYYVGQLTLDRKLDTLILGMASLPHCVLVIQGTYYQMIQQIYKKDIDRYQVADRIFFLPPIKDKEIISYASSADIGIFICDTSDNKMYHALPNKLFEYVYAGVPQVSCHSVEVDKIINEKNIGLLFDAHSPESFSKAVIKILSSDKYHEIKNSVLSYRDQLVKNNEFDLVC